MATVYASNDKVSAEWFAPAGLNRGGIEKAVGVMDRLNFGGRDTLYEGKVNPINHFQPRYCSIWSKNTTTLFLCT